MTAINTKNQTSTDAAAAENVVIKCAGLTKVFRDFWLRNRVKAVDAIDLEVNRGEVFGLLGPNGSGKSTTIKMILGLLHPTAGRIAVFGKRPDDVATKKLIGYLPEESYLYRFLNARETLDYYAKIFHLPREQRKARIDMLLDMVGLGAVQRRPVGEYSKGMQRRIGLAQALINDPQLLILDEPTSGLDPIGTRQIKDLIIELARRGKTIVMCSHLLGDVEDVCDRVSIMFGGKVRMSGTVDQLLVQQDMTTIYSRQLDDEAINAVEKVLESKGMAIDRVEHPRQRLESLFLDIVQQAQTEGTATSGATSGGQIADFLVDHDKTESEDIIEQLMQPAAQDPTPKVPEPVEETQSPAPAQTEGDAEVIDQLVTGDESPADDESPAGGMLSAAMADVEPYVEEDEDSQPSDEQPQQEIKPQLGATSNDEQADQSFINALMEAAETRSDDDEDKNETNNSNDDQSSDSRS